MKNELSLHHLPKELIFLIASLLDKKSLLSFRSAIQLFEQITIPLFLNIAKDKIASEKLACGNSSVIFSDSKGQSWGWGNNLFNQLGLGASSPKFDYKEFFTPTQGTFNNIVSIAMNNDFSLALTRDGTVLSSGANDLGQLGLGNREKFSIPREILALKNENVTQIATGNSFALAAIADGTLYSWGANDFGQLGHGHKLASHTPQVISSIKNVAKITAGDSFSAVLTKNGELYTWGNLGELLEDNLTPQLVPNLKDIVSISAGKNYIVNLRKDGKVVVWGKNYLEQLCIMEVPDIENIVKISANNSPHNYGCLALSIQGEVYSWSQAKIRLNTCTPQKIEGLEKIVAISQGENFSVALDWNGTIYSWGKNNHGQLGISKKSVSFTTTPQKISLFEEPVKTKFFNRVSDRLAKEQLAKTFLNSKQKSLLHQDLSFFSSRNENQFNNEIKELSDFIEDEKSSAAQVEDKIDSYQKLYRSSDDTSKKSFYSCLSDMKQKLSTEKTRIVEETKAKVFSRMMT